MKALFLAAMLALCSCATGSTADVPEEQESVYVAPSKKPTPPTPEPAPVESDADVPHCKINAYWSLNCYVVEIFCEGRQPQIEVSCGPGRPLWPWEIIPDPPYDNRR